MMKPYKRIFNEEIDILSVDDISRELGKYGFITEDPLTWQCEKGYKVVYAVQKNRNQLEIYKGDGILGVFEDNSDGLKKLVNYIVQKIHFK